MSHVEVETSSRQHRHSNVSEVEEERNRGLVGTLVVELIKTQKD